MRALFALGLVGLAFPAYADCTALVGGGEVLLPDGLATGVSVVLDGDRIAAVGAAPEGLVVRDGAATWRGAACTLVDTTGATVTAGLVDAATMLGVVEVEQEDATNDHDAGSSDGIRAAFAVADAYNPRSSLIPIQRVEGVTSAVVHPSGGRVSGQAALVDLAGATQGEAVVARSAAIWVNLGGSSKAQALLDLRELLEDARFYQRKKAAFDTGSTRELAASRLDLEALEPVLAGKVPLVLDADRAGDIEAVLRFAKEQGVRVVVRGAAEGHLVADQLAAAAVPVIVDPLVYGAGSFDELHGRADNPALLRAAGVTVVISSFSSHNARTVKQLAGNAVRGGMDRVDALQAITQAPAQVFGSTDRGRLAVGAVANVVVWKGDPLELGTPVAHVFVRGRDLPLTSRQTELLERYRTLPGTPLPARPLPE